MIDPTAARQRFINVTQGEFKISADPNLGLTTILGSCVAACLFDPVANIGGLNHFLLPGDKYNDSTSMSYGVNAMELLINEMLKNGGVRKRFQAKLFGGASMVAGLSDAGEQNAKFALEFLQMEEIPCVSQSLGGTQARRVRFWPATGQAKLRLMPADRAAQRPAFQRASVPAAPRPAPQENASDAGAIELF